jgi:hypothetical protein
MRNDPDDPFDEHGLLKDGRVWRCPAKMMDSLQGSVARHYQRPQDSAAFPRRRGVHVTDAQNGTMGLHRPGWRLPSGGHAGDQALRDAVEEETQTEYEIRDHEVRTAWRRRDAMAADPEDDAQVQARASAIGNALFSRGHSPDEIEAYLNGCEDDDLLDGDIGEHVQAFEQQQNGRDTRSIAVDRRMRLEELYQARDRALSEAWKRK